MHNGSNDKQKTTEILPSYGYMPYCPPQEDTVDFRELWKILKQHKRTILWTTLFFVSIALLYLLLAHPKYEAKATVAIGKMLIKTSSGTLQEKYFEDAKRIKAMLDVEYDTAGKYRDKNTTAYIDSITIPRKTKGLLVITALGESNLVATNMLHSPVNELVQRGELYLKSILDVKRNKLKTIESNIAYLKNVRLIQLKKQLQLVHTVDLKKIDEKISTIQTVDIPTITHKIDVITSEIQKKRQTIDRLTKQILPAAKKDPALGTMASIQLANLQNDIERLVQRLLDLQKKKETLQKLTIPDLKKQKTAILEQKIPKIQAQIQHLANIEIPKLRTQIEDLKTSMAPPYLVSTHLVGEIRIHDKPVKPQKALILVVSLVTGLMFGVFFAFFREYLQKEETQSQMDK